VILLLPLPRKSEIIRVWGTELTLLFRDPLLGLVAPLDGFLFLWPLVGFGVGQLCGVLIRRPLRYRLSAGEVIEWPSAMTEGKVTPETERFPWASVIVPPGQGILWSVGADRTDDGGRREGFPGWWHPGEDRIVLVPLPRRE
jgi:hypothetical protein